jgi:hypothetical protein
MAEQTDENTAGSEIVAAKAGALASGDRARPVV